MGKLSNIIKWGAGVIVSLPAMALYLSIIHLQGFSVACEPKRQEATAPASQAAEQVVLQLVALEEVMDILQQPPVTAASIVAADSVGNGYSPQIEVAANGVNIIKIAPPNAQGVSYNQYREFEAKSEGTLFSNNPQEVMTELAGVLPANGRLNGRAASLIINELVADNHNKIELLGPVEVVGTGAALIFASEAGINTERCRFINSHNVTLTTGKLEFEQGQWSGYQIEKGDISIGEQGIQASEGQMLNLLTTSLYFGGDASANTLMIVSGKTHISSDMVTIAPTPSPHSPHREGVFLNGTLMVSHGVVIRTYNNCMSNNNSLVAKKVTIESDGILNNSGQILSQGDIKIDSKEGVRNSNTMKAADNLEIKGYFISNSKREAEQDGGALLSAGKKLQLVAESDIANSGTIMTNGDGWLSTKSVSNNSGATLMGENIHFSMPQEAVGNLGQLKAAKIYYLSPIPNEASQ